MMLTRCPHCATAFRVTPEQLKARQGQVRCGMCNEVFDALATLADESGTPVEPAAGPAPDEPDGRHEPQLAPEPEPKPEQEPEPEPEPEITPPPLPEPLLHEEEAPKRRHWPWLVGSLVAALALTLQAALHFRTELAVTAPDAKPTLKALCEIFGCTLELPRKIELIGIETSDLVPDKDRPGHLQLAASLRNRARFAQAWPHLELTLTDAADRAVLRRALAPTDYLPPGTPVADGFPARSEQAIQLDLQANDVPAAGYRLYVFHP